MRQQKTLIYKHFQHTNLKIALKTNNFLEGNSVMKKKNYKQKMEVNVSKVVDAGPDFRKKYVGPPEKFLCLGVCDIFSL